MWLTVIILLIFITGFLVVLKSKVETYVPEIIFLNEDEKGDDNTMLNDGDIEDGSNYYYKDKKPTYYNRSKIRLRIPTGLSSGRN
jgi:hypothetical protein